VNRSPARRAFAAIVTLIEDVKALPAAPDEDPDGA
jgi:hypothetical protein